MEFYDVVDKNRKLLGYTKLRGMKLEENEFLKMAENNEIVGFLYDRYEIINDKLKKDW